MNANDWRLDLIPLGLLKLSEPKGIFMFPTKY